MSRSYYEVTCKCGHVGKAKYIPVAFGVKANSGKEAAQIARNIPRVKHDHKDCIISVYEISLERYNELKYINNNDSYLKCKNIQEQKRLDLEYRLEEDSHSVKKEYIKSDYTSCTFKKKTIKKPKKYFNHIYDFYRNEECLYA